MRFASPSPPPTPNARSALKQLRTPKPTGRYGLDLKRDWEDDDSSDDDVEGEDGSSDEANSSDEENRDRGISSRLENGRRPIGKNHSSPLKVATYVDEIESYDSLSRSLAWRKSQKAALAHSAKLSHILAPSKRLPTQDADDLADVRRLLENLRVERAEEERRERGEFEKRNKKLWDDIESTIQTSEQEHLQTARLKQAEADKKASALRQQEEAKEAARKKVEDEAKAAAERKRKEAEEAEREAADQATKQAASAEALKMADVEAAKKRDGGGGLEVKAAEFGRWVDSMKSIKTEVLPKVNNSTDWRKKCNAVKRQVTPKIGQITNDRTAILRITSELSLILHSALSASTEIYTWILNHLSKTLIKQAEAEITANPSAAWPLARVIVGLMLMGHGEGLGNVLMSRLVKKCCWVIPFSPAKQPGQTDAEHLKLTGHLANTQESTLEYTNRLSGILTLYATILCVLPSPDLLPPPPPSHPTYPTFSSNLIPPHFRLSAGWSWIASILRPPLSQLEPTPTLIVAFLDVAAPRMLDVYGAQMKKVLMAIGKDVLAGGGTLGGGKNKPGVARLGLKLEEWQEGGFGKWKDMDGSEVK